MWEMPCQCGSRHGGEAFRRHVGSYNAEPILCLRRSARRILRPDRASLLFLGPHPSRQVRKKLRPKIINR